MDIVKYVRLDKVTYSDGREINYDYGTADAIDDIMSRLASIKDDDDSTVLASYRYLGAGRIVTEDYEEIQVNLDYAGDTNTFSALDRFGRVVDQVWNDYGATPDVVLDEYTYTYDRVGNRESRDNELKTDGSLDESYDYDDLYRLIDFDRGAGVTQDWDLDALGNWSTFDDGTSQSQAVNKANEIEEIDGDDDNVDYDAAGNMIKVPKLDGSGEHFYLKYDAWNRLVKVYDDGGTPLIAEYQYDGTGRRIVKGVDDGTDGSLDTFTHYFHNGANQVIETRKGEDVSGAAPAAESLEPKYQNIWSERYVDSMILRDEYDSQGDIITTARIYYLSDANFNVTALVNAASGNVVERYLYTPYGTVTVLDPDDFSVEAGGTAYDNTTLYTGRESDPETGLMYYRARYYHSELGRFVSRDPMRYDAEDLNLYRYVGSSPLDESDPQGLKKLPAPPAIFPEPPPSMWGRLVRCCGPVGTGVCVFLDAVFGSGASQLGDAEWHPDVETIWDPDDLIVRPRDYNDPREVEESCNNIQTLCFLSKLGHISGGKWGRSRCVDCAEKCKSGGGIWPSGFWGTDGKWRECKFTAVTGDKFGYGY